MKRVYDTTDIKSLMDKEDFIEEFEGIYIDSNNNVIDTTAISGSIVITTSSGKTKDFSAITQEDIMTFINEN